MTLEEVFALAESQINAGAVEAVDRCIEIIEAEDGKLPPSLERTIRRFGPIFFQVGAAFALKTYDCYPKT